MNRNFLRTLNARCADKWVNSEGVSCGNEIESRKSSARAKMRRRFNEVVIINFPNMAHGPLQTRNCTLWADCACGSHVHKLERVKFRVR